MVRPEYKEFLGLAREATLVPVVKSVSADLLTPVSAFLAIAANEPNAFLLESVERGEQIGRYSFLGARPYMQLQAHAGEVVLETDKRKTPRRAYDRAAADIAVLEKKLAAGLRPALWNKSSQKTNSKLKIQTASGRERFIHSVQRAKQYIAAGDIFQVVLSQRQDFVPSVAPFDIYRALRAGNPSPYLYFLRMDNTHVLGSSPEMLVRVTGRKLEYRPIAGTHPRSQDEAEDQRSEEH